MKALERSVEKPLFQRLRLPKKNSFHTIIAQSRIIFATVVLILPLLKHTLPKVTPIGQDRGSRSPEAVCEVHTSAVIQKPYLSFLTDSGMPPRNIRQYFMGVV